MAVTNEIDRAIEDLGLLTPRLSATRVRDVLLRIEKFALPGTSSIWERLSAPSSLQNPHGWRLIAGFDVSQPVILVVDDGARASGFEFETMRDVVAVLGDSFGFEFYLTDAEASFLIAFNHHDFLIGAGLAARWIDELRDSILVLDADDQQLVARCLHACVKGPFFPETEFEALFNTTRERVADIAALWPSNAEDSETQSVALYALANLLGYPHLLNNEFADWVGSYRDVSRLLYQTSSAWKSG